MAELVGFRQLGFESHRQPSDQGFLLGDLFGLPEVSAPAARVRGGRFALTPRRMPTDWPSGMTPELALHVLADDGAVGWSYPRRMTDEETAELVIDRLLRALAAQLHTSGSPSLAAGAVEALADLSRAQADVIFGQAGHLVHYGADTEPLKTLIHAITAIQRDEAPADAVVKPGDEVRLVGEVPESLADYDETWLRETTFVVRYVGRNAMVGLQPDLIEDYVIATVPAAGVQPL